MNPVFGDSFLLFVYGTLMRGGVRHWLLADQRFVGEARTLPRYALYDLGTFPGMVRRDGGVAVSGELYEVAANRLADLDDEEGGAEPVSHGTGRSGRTGRAVVRLSLSAIR